MFPNVVPLTVRDAYDIERSEEDLDFCREGQLQRVHHVLNECLVDRGASPNMVQLEAYVDGHHITTVQVEKSSLELDLLRHQHVCSTGWERDHVCAGHCINNVQE